MELRFYHWLTVLALAAGLHLGLALLLRSPAPPPQPGEGIRISLGSGSGAPATHAVTGGEAGAEQAEPDKPVDRPRPETGSELVPESEPKPKPEPVPEIEPEPRPEPVTKPELQPRPEPRPEPRPLPPSEPPTAAVRTGSQAQQQAEGAGGRTDQVRDNGSGGGAARSTGQTPASVLQRYYAELALWLERHKRYPANARRRRQQGTVKLHFIVDRRGQVLSHRIVSESGYRLLDREAEDMLRRARPLPAFPVQMTQAKLEVVVPVSFSLR